MRIPGAKRLKLCVLAAAALSLLAGCSQLRQPEPKPYFAETAPPAIQEFRWSNGRSPRSFDPAKAAAAPETDLARALYEGLTDLEPQTLNEIPAAAERWEASDDKLVWRFYIREGAVWSNGQNVTAEDFVRSWKRLADPKTEAAHKDLLKNIRGLSPQPASTSASLPGAAASPSNTNSAPAPPATTPETTVANANTASPDGGTKVPELGVVAESERVLRVSLVHPDPDLPKLLAHPIFRPVFGEPAEEKENAVTNGPFRLSSIEKNNIVLDRSENYWDRRSVKIERVKLMAMDTPESALEAYRSGEIDAITNAEFSPAALKLLEPFDDFRRTVHNAVNLYEFNSERWPFNDRRVRRALAIGFDRTKITEGEMQGTTRPAASYLPQSSSVANQQLAMDVERARSLLDDAGFPEGGGFPIVRLLVNRNDLQLRVAKAVAQMWRENLGIETEIVVRDPEEFEAARKAGDYDAVRRNVVLPTTNETSGMLAIFGSGPGSMSDEEELQFLPEASNSSVANGSPTPSPSAAGSRLLKEEEALYEVKAAPLYFPTSYSLVKPYVKGFDSNALDAPSLKSVSIDAKWRNE